MNFNVFAIALIVLLSVAAGRPAAAQANYAILDNFGGSSGLQNPGRLIAASDGFFYGVATLLTPGTGGAPSTSSSCIFKMDRAGAISIFHNFSDNSLGAGAAVQTLIQGTDGNFYGTGLSNTAAKGLVFSVTPVGVVTVLHTFGDGSVANDGAFPNCNLVQGADGTLYGSTTLGGSTTGGTAWPSGAGTLFKMTTSGTETILHSFQDGSLAVDGSDPTGPVVLAADGTLYTATGAGGSDVVVSGTGAVTGFGSGTIFTLTSGGTPSLLFDFGASAGHASGTNPDWLIQASSSDLYGTAYSNGVNNGGTAFKLTTAGVFTLLHSFGTVDTNIDGAQPQSVFEGTDGNIYGETSVAGLTTRQDTNSQSGTVFEITPAGAYSILHSFGSDGTLFDGGTPLSGTMVEGTDGLFYGVTSHGGSFVFVGENAREHVDGAGTAFRLQVISRLPVAPAEPNNVAAMPGNGLVTVSWSPVPGATSYNIYRGTSPGGESGVPLASPTGTDYTDTFAANGTTYYYTVAAIYTTFLSVQSAEASATPSTTALHTFQAGLQMISAPMDFTNVPLADVLNAVNPKIAVWDPTTFSYDVTPTPPADTLYQGKGAWIKLTQPASLLVQGADKTTNGKVFVQLQVGWNMIADPYSEQFSEAQLIFINNAQQNFFSFAVSTSIIYPPLYGYTVGASGYTKLISGSHLQPYTGYWVYALKPCIVEYDQDVAG